jgi:Icc protein
MRLAQITDLHLPFVEAGLVAAEEDNNKDYRLLGETLSKIKSLRADICVVSGDLLNIRWEQSEQRLPQGRIRQSYETVKRILDEAGMPYLVLPGNHDHEEYFRQVFDPSSQRTAVRGYELVCFFDAEDKHHIPHRRGRELSRFKKLLSLHAGLPQIHLQHFLLTDPPQDDYPYSYAHRARLRRRIKKSGRVVLCISGHYHKGTPLIKDKGSYYSTGPAFCQPERSFRVYEIQHMNVTCRDYYL